MPYALCPMPYAVSFISTIPVPSAAIAAAIAAATTNTYLDLAIHWQKGVDQGHHGSKSMHLKGPFFGLAIRVPVMQRTKRFKLKAPNK